MEPHPSFLVTSAMEGDSKKKRLDEYLVDSGMARSRTLAQKMIRENHVQVRRANKNLLINKPSFLVDPLNDSIHLGSEHNLDKYVSRGGLKLEFAISHFDIQLQGKVVLDVGQSTGGFTDCCLQHGAQKVIGIDVGTQQIDSKLLNDPRVSVIEKTHVHLLEQNPLVKTVQFDLVVCDLSFISWEKYWSALLPFSNKILFLIKPQFELSKPQLDKHGVVKNPESYEAIKNRIMETLASKGLSKFQWTECPIRGGSGNREFFLFIDQSPV